MSTQLTQQLQAVSQPTRTLCKHLVQKGPTAFHGRPCRKEAVTNGYCETHFNESKKRVQEKLTSAGPAVIIRFPTDRAEKLLASTIFENQEEIKVYTATGHWSYRKWDVIKTQLTKYVAKSKQQDNWSVVTENNIVLPCGRMTVRIGRNDNYALRYGVSMMPKVIRNCLFGQNFYDIDQAAAHCVITGGLFKHDEAFFSKMKHSISRVLHICQVDNREAELKRLQTLTGCTRDEAKILITSMLYGGSVRDWFQQYALDYEPSADKPDLYNYYSELETEFRKGAEMLLKTAYKETFELCERTNMHDDELIKNIYCRAWSWVCCGYERKLLLAIAEQAAEDGIEVGALIHDGLHVYKSKTIEAMTNEYLPRWEKGARELVRMVTGIDFPIRLTIKAMEFDESLLQPSKGLSLADHETYESVRADFEQYVFLVTRSKRYLMLPKYAEDMPEFCTKRDLETCYEHLKYYEIEYNEKQRCEQKVGRSFLKRYLEDEGKLTYQKIDFAPPGYPVQLRSDAYNGWSGFAAESTIPDGNDYSAQIKLISDHLLYLCNNEVQPFIYNLLWYASLAQFPGIKPNVMLTMKSLMEGNGKSFMATLTCNMIGRKHSVTVSNVSDLIGTFTATLDNKVYIHLEEFNQTALTVKENELLLDLLVSPQDRITYKGANPDYRNSCTHFTAASNNINAFRTVNQNGQDARRIYYQEVTAMPKDSEYYSTLMPLAHNEQVIRAWFDYLKTVRYTAVKDATGKYTLAFHVDGTGDSVSKIDWKALRPETEQAKEAKEHQQPLEHQWFAEFIAQKIREMNKKNKAQTALTPEKRIVKCVSDSGKICCGAGCTDACTNFTRDYLIPVTTVGDLWIEFQKFYTERNKAYQSSASLFGNKLKTILAQNELLDQTHFRRTTVKGYARYYWFLREMETQLINKKFLKPEDVDPDQADENKAFVSLLQRYRKDKQPQVDQPEETQEDQPESDDEFTDGEYDE